MNRLENVARQLARRRLERDREVAERAGHPCFLKLEAYLPQCRKDAAVFFGFKPEGMTWRNVRLLERCQCLQMAQPRPGVPAAGNAGWRSE